MQANPCIYKNSLSEIAKSLGIHPSDTVSLELLQTLITWTSYYIGKLMSQRNTRAGIVLLEETDRSKLISITDQYWSDIQARLLNEKYKKQTGNEFLDYLWKNKCVDSRILEINQDFSSGSITFSIEYPGITSENFLSSDAYGSYAYDHRSWKRIVNIYYDMIFQGTISYILLTWEALSPENFFIMILCHELAHMFSSEVLSKSTIDSWKILYDLRRSILGDEQPVEDVLHLVKYRTGIKLITWESDYPTETALNEAITELVAEEIYESLRWKAWYEKIRWAYVYSYKKEVQCLRQALSEFSWESEQSYTENWSILRKGYFLWWEALMLAVSKVIDPIFPRFYELMSEP